VKAKTIDLTDIAQIQDRLRTSPSRPETRVRYVKAIEMMASEIHAMRSKGYGWNDIAAVLTESGLEVSATTLRTYLGRVASEPSPPRQGHPRRRRKSFAANIPSPVLAESRRSSTPAIRDAPARIERISKPSPAAGPPTVHARVATTSTPSPVDSETTPSWSFAVRPDTPDL
jgi:hypothetical protein